MTTILGDEDYRYEELDDWAQLPDGWSFKEVADVAVDADDRVYVFNRSDHPMMVFEQDGTFVTSWGQGLFTRAHGLTIGPDGMLYCVDDDGHSVRRCTADGELLTTYGTPGQPAPLHGGQPFNRPTKVAFDPRSGDLYISDGYGNARVHKFTVDGEHLFSWGEYGTDPGQFNLVHSVHSVCTEIFDDGNVYVADIGQIVTELTVNADYPNLGCCVSVHDLSGRRLWHARPGEGPGQYLDQWNDMHRPCGR